MANSITCPNCGDQFQVDEVLAGKPVPCPKCEEVVVVPKAVPDYRGNVEWLVAEARRRTKTPSEEYWTGGVLIFIGVCLAVLGAIVTMNEGPPGVVISTLGWIILLAGIIRWAVSPLIAQNDAILKELRERKE